MEGLEKFLTDEPNLKESTHSRKNKNNNDIISMSIRQGHHHGMSLIKIQAFLKRTHSIDIDIECLEKRKKELMK